MTAPTSSMQDNPSRDQLIHEMERLVLLQQESLAALKLAAYAVDAMRVLGTFDRHADMSKAFDDMLKAICSDWRNPGSINPPADLLVDVLFHAVAALERTHQEMGRLTSVWDG